MFGHEPRGRALSRDVLHIFFSLYPQILALHRPRSNGAGDKGQDFLLLRTLFF